MDPYPVDCPRARKGAQEAEGWKHAVRYWNRLSQWRGFEPDKPLFSEFDGKNFDDQELGVWGQKSNQGVADLTYIYELR